MSAGRSFRQHAAVVKDGDAVRQLHDHLHVVLDNEDGEIAGDAAHQGHGLVGLRRAHPGGWLVQAQELRLGCERNADLEVALLAVREIAGELLALAAQPDQLQHGFALSDKIAVNAL